MTQSSPVTPGWPVFALDEREAVDAVLASGNVNYWTGENGREFEREYADALGVGHAIALMNGTVALELALRMWGVGPGDEVVVTPRSFIASISCVVQQGARPVFADVDRDSGNLTAATIERVLTRPHEGHRAGASWRLALRDGRDHGLGQFPGDQGDRGLCPGPRCCL